MDFLDDIGVVVRAAAKDAVQAILNPVHSVKVVLGVEPEPSVSEKVSRALDEARRQESDTTSVKPTSASS
jgi:hypothetical protein